MDARVSKFLEENGCRVDRESPYTNTSKITRKGNFFISSELKPAFWEVYCDAVKNRRVVGLTEKWEDEMPVIQDTDLKYLFDAGSNRKYTPLHILATVKIYQKVLTDILLDLHPKHLTCCVLEKPAPYVDEKEFVKEGYHLHFPYIVLPIDVQMTTIRDRVLEKVIHDKTFGDLNTCNTVEQIIDEAIPRVTWMMYGAAKDHRLPPYLLTRIYDHQGHEVETDEALRPIFEMIKTQSSRPRTKTLVERAIGSDVESDSDDELTKFDEDGEDGMDRFLEKDGDINYYLPLILSVRGRTVTHQLKPDIVIRSVKKSKRTVKTGTPKSIPLEQIHEELDEADELLRLLSPSRYSDRGRWIELGWLLHCIGNGTDRALNMWIDFSSQWEYFNGPKECEDLWHDMYYGSYTLAVMKSWAKRESPDAYINWHKKKVDPLIHRAAKTRTPYDVANVLFKKYDGMFVCASIKKDRWYEFRGHKWVELDSGVTLKRKISTELFNDFTGYMKVVIDKRTASTDEDTREDCERLMKYIMEVASNLKKTTFKSSIMTECKELFYVEKFEQNLDTNPNLIGFENGVYDLDNMIFREGHPGDNVTLSTGYEYEEYDIDHPDVKNVIRFLQQIFVNIKLRKYFRRYMATCLSGGNINKHFMIFTGRRGDNGKSVTVKLIEMAFGEYVAKVPTALLTCQRGKSGDATPELAMLRGKKIAIAQEPGEGDKFNNGQLKELTGNDSIYVRGLFEGGGTMKILFKLILQCNRIPRIQANDKAVMNRTKVLEFESLFNSDAPEDKDERWKKKHFYADTKLESKIEAMTPAFMWLLLKEYPKYLKEGIKAPDELVEATKQYSEDNDLYQMFISECTEVDESQSVNITTLWTNFVKWHKIGFPSEKLVPRNDLLQELNSRWGQRNKNLRWEGRCIIVDEPGPSSSIDVPIDQPRLTISHKDYSSSDSRSKGGESDYSSSSSRMSSRSKRADSQSTSGESDYSSSSSRRSDYLSNDMKLGKPKRLRRRSPPSMSK
jgi:P4 family phage/plasmid primase-like protien